MMTCTCLLALALAADPSVRYDARAGRFEAPAEAGSITVRVEDDNGQPAPQLLWGTSGNEAGVTWFRPRFPLVPGLRYHVTLRTPTDITTQVIALPPPTEGKPSRVVRIAPGTDRLPENLLKFYVHFSAPMKRGEVYHRVRLLDQAGEPIDDPFLELDEELWDPTGQRITIFIDPGRIKRGLKPRENVGPVFEEGKSYTLVIDRGWPDQSGQPLKETVRKPFQVVAAAMDRVAPATWTVTPPRNPKDSLTVALHEPLDRALLERLVWVETTAGQRIDGHATVNDTETAWQFQPKRPWSAGDYRLRIDPALEDLAGNRPDRLFDTDTSEETPPVEAVTARPFTIAFASPAAAPAAVEKTTARWPSWRGPYNTGVAGDDANPPTTWDANTNIRWKAPLPGRGSATPIVWGDQVFVLTARETDRKADAVVAANDKFEKKTTAPDHYYRFEVLSFDRHTGKPRWQRTATEQVPHEGHHPTHSYAAGSPTTDGKRLYVSFGSFGTYAYTLDGKLIWSRDLGRLTTRYGWGEAVTPVIHGDTLLLNWDQEENAALIALDAATGQTRWRAERPKEVSSWNTPLVVDHAGRTQVIVNGTGRIRGYDLATGKEIWSCAGMTVNAIPSPVSADGVVYVMSGYRGAAAVAVSLDAVGDVTGTNKVLWSYGKGTPYVPSPLLAGGRLYFTQTNTGLLTVLDARTGQAILDRERLPSVTSFYGSPILAGGRIYLCDRSGTTVVLKPGAKLEVLAVNKLNDTIDASPVAVGGDLLLRGERFLYCVGTTP